MFPMLALLQGFMSDQSQIHIQFCLSQRKLCRTITQNKSYCILHKDKQYCFSNWIKKLNKLKAYLQECVDSDC